MCTKIASLERRKRRVIPSRHRLAMVLACAASISSVQSAPTPGQRKSLLQLSPSSRLRQTIIGGSSVGVEREERENSEASKSATSSSANFGATTDNSQAAANTSSRSSTLSAWPCFDDLDKMLIKISLPVIATFAIQPIVSAADLFFINRLGNALAVAGQSAANQVFGSVFWLTSFLPSITAILVSKEFAKGNQEGVQDAVCQALFLGLIFAAIGTSGLLMYPEKVLRTVLKKEAPALEFASPYLQLRALSFVPSLISIVGFSAFRGQHDTTTPVKINLFSNIFHVLLVPVFTYVLSMGINGAALGTVIADCISGGVYLYLMNQRHMIRYKRIFQIPQWTKLRPLLVGGMALQLRNVAFNFTFLMVTRAIQSMDDSGVAPAAHAIAMQTFQVGGIVLLALSVVAQTVVPSALIEGVDHARSTVKRLMNWGFLLGTAFGALQIVMLPLILRSTPLQEVRDAARVPAYIASFLQIINGLVFIGEGVMTGCGDFLQLALCTGIASVLCLFAINSLKESLGLTAVWIGFGVFNGSRLIYVWLHQYFFSPLAHRRAKENKID